MFFMAVDILPSYILSPFPTGCLCLESVNNLGVVCHRYVVGCLPLGWFRISTSAPAGLPPPSLPSPRGVATVGGSSLAAPVAPSRGPSEGRGPLPPFIEADATPHPSSTLKLTPAGSRRNWPPPNGLG